MTSYPLPADAGWSKEAAAGILIFLLEELGDARLRAEQLQGYVQSGLELVNKSGHKDEVFEVAGDLLQGVPDALFRLSKALDAAALAAAKLDYEETKQGLKPEKVDELEAVAEDIRMRYLNRRSHQGVPMTPHQAAAYLQILADETEATGAIPVQKLARILAALEGGRPKRAAASAAGIFRQMADYLRGTPRPQRLLLAGDLRKIMAATLLSEAEIEAGAGQAFQKENPKITDEEAKRIDEMHDKNKNVVKDKAASIGVTIMDAVEDIERDILQMTRPVSLVVRGTEQVLDDLMEHDRIKAEAKAFGDAVKDLTASHKKAEKAVAKLQAKIGQGDEGEDGFDLSARFPAGKPADPKKHMAPADAETWDNMNDKYKDVVKDQYKAASIQKEASEVGMALARRGIDATYGASRGHGFWIRDRGWVDMKTARELAGSTTPTPAGAGLAWGTSGQ